MNVKIGISQKSAVTPSGRLYGIWDFFTFSKTLRIYSRAKFFYHLKINDETYCLESGTGKTWASWPISCHWCLAIPPESIRKTETFWFFQGA